MSGEQRHRLDPLAALGRQIGQRDGEQGAADAVADRVRGRLAGNLLDHVQRLQGAFLHVVGETALGEVLIGIDPGHAEDRHALVNAPLDERFVRGQVEDVELVDPGRDDQQRYLEDLFGRRRILDELHQFVLIDHLARGERQVGTDFKTRGIGLSDPKIAAAGLNVLRQHVHSTHEVFGIRGQGLAQQLRIGEHEVRGRNRIRNLPHIEFGLVALARVEPAGVRHQLVGPVGGQQIGLLEKIEELIGRPFGIGKAFVARIGLRHRSRRLARHALDGRGP